MKKKIVLWGRDANEERILLALELKAEENKVDIYTFPTALATDELNKQLLFEWRDGKEMTFPEGYTHIERELSVSESLLPDDIKVEKTDIIQRAQTEWHFVVLSSKLNESYQTELAELREKVEALTTYDQTVWDELKSFWSKVQGQVRERNLFREHSNTLRQKTDELFEKLKGLRAVLDEQFKSLAKENYDKFNTMLDEVEAKASKSTRLKDVFDELKQIQSKFKDADLTREYRTKIWNRIDAAFKMVKEKRFGPGANTGGNSATDRLQKRFNGLMSAIQRMEKSINYDKNDLEFQNKRISSSETGQLEAQIRQAKIKMIEERIRSKGVKLEDMNKTKLELEEKMAQQKVRDEKRAEKQKVAQAKEEAKTKIAAEIKEAAEARKTEDEKLKKAAEAISKKEEPKKEETTEDKSMLEKATDMASDLASSASEKISEIAETVESTAMETAAKIAGGVDSLEAKGKEETEEAKEKETENEEAPLSASNEEEATEKIESESEGLLDRAGNILKGAASVVTEKAGELVEDVKEEVSAIQEKGKEVMEGNNDSIDNQKSETPMDEKNGNNENNDANEESLTEKASGLLGGLVDKVKDTVNELVEDVTEDIGAVKDKVDDATAGEGDDEGLASKATGMLGGLVGKVKDTVSELVEDVTEDVGAIKDKADDAVASEGEEGSITEKASGMLGGLVDKVKNTVSEMVEDITEDVDAIKDKAEDTANDVADKVDEATDDKNS